MRIVIALLLFVFVAPAGAQRKKPEPFCLAEVARLVEWAGDEIEQPHEYAAFMSPIESCLGCGSDLESQIRQAEQKLRDLRRRQEREQQHAKNVGRLAWVNAQFKLGRVPTQCGAKTP
jgi:hypothetical protein